MPFPRLRHGPQLRIIVYFALIGMALPCLLDALTSLVLPRTVIPDWVFLVLWPAFGFAMASDGDAGSEVLGFSLSLNGKAFVYVVLGVVVAFFYGRCWRTNLPCVPPRSSD